MGEVIDLAQFKSNVENKLTQDRDPSVPELYICMEDRRLLIGGIMQHGRLYSQVGGGASGIGQDIATVMEVRTPGSFINRGHSAYDMGRLAAKVARRGNFLLLNHEACAAHGGGEEIAMTTINKPEEVYERARLIKPDITFDDVEQVREAGIRIVNSGKLADPHGALHKFEAGDAARNIPPVETVPIEDKPHSAVAFIADYRRGVQFDVGGANAAGTPAYYSSLGNLEDLCHFVNPTIAMPYEDMLTINAIRIAAIGVDHLQDPRGEALPQIMLDRAA